MPDRKRILISPLDWGLGHATRCIPLIRQLLQQDAEVLIAADGRPYELLKQEFPSLELIRLKGYDIHYPSNGAMAARMLCSIPKILKGIREEHEALKEIIAARKIHAVISDNRYGLWNPAVKSIFITHQLMIKSPFGERFLQRTVARYVKHYDECWIPDEAGTDNLSGDLGHPGSIPPNAFYIGALSRFSPLAGNEKKYELMAIISGPEPQRSLFEELMLKQLLAGGQRSLIVCGRPEQNVSEQRDNVSIRSHLDAAEMQEAIAGSELILARSGYSTILDLAAMEKKAVFIPTPGQTEQEYLAERLMEKKIAFSMRQENFSLETALRSSTDYKGLGGLNKSEQLERRITSLLSSL